MLAKQPARGTDAVHRARIPIHRRVPHSLQNAFPGGFKVLHCRQSTLGGCATTFGAFVARAAAAAAGAAEADPDAAGITGVRFPRRVRDACPRGCGCACDPAARGGGTTSTYPAAVLAACCCCCSNFAYCSYDGIRAEAAPIIVRPGLQNAMTSSEAQPSAYLEARRLPSRDEHWWGARTPPHPPQPPRFSLRGDRSTPSVFSRSFSVARGRLFRLAATVLPSGSKAKSWQPRLYATTTTSTRRGSPR